MTSKWRGAPVPLRLARPGVLAGTLPGGRAVWVRLPEGDAPALLFLGDESKTHARRRQMRERSAREREQELSRRTPADCPRG